MTPPLKDDENPYAQRPRPLLRRLAGRLAGMIAIPLLTKLLEREKLRQFVLHHLSNKYSLEEATFRGRLPPGLRDVRGFEDCCWLFSANKLNHGLIRLTLDEAVFLYKLIRRMDHPNVVELGRFKGGSTFLMASAGAQVLSIDNGALPGQVEFTQALEHALQQTGLAGQVENVIADALSYPTQPESRDLIFIDIAAKAPVVKAALEQWWAALKPGGYMLLGDGKASPLIDIVDMVKTLDIHRMGGTRLPDPPGSLVLFQKN